MESVRVSIVYDRSRVNAHVCLTRTLLYIGCLRLTVRYFLCFQCISFLVFGSNPLMKLMISTYGRYFCFDSYSNTCYKSVGFEFIYNVKVREWGKWEGVIRRMTATS